MAYRQVWKQQYSCSIKVKVAIGIPRQARDKKHLQTRPPTTNQRDRVGRSHATSAFGAVSVFYVVAFTRSQEEIGLQSVLAHVEIVIAALHGQEFFMFAALHDLARLNDQNLVGLTDGGQPVSDYKRGPAFH